MKCEFEFFLDHLLPKKINILSTRKADTFAHQWRELFPLTNNLYQLVLTTSVSVALHKIPFLRLKLVKTYLRCTKTNVKLESLMLMLCEKCLIDNVNIESVVHAWSRLKSRRVTTNFSQRKKD